MRALGGGVRKFYLGKLKNIFHVFLKGVRNGGCTMIISLIFLLTQKVGFYLHFVSRVSSTFFWERGEKIFSKRIIR